VLRTFYFTRRLGGAVIAIAIGFFAVFPMTYVMGAQLMDTYASGGASVLFASATSAIENATVNTQYISTGTFQLTRLVNVSANSISFNPFSSVTTLLNGFAGIFTTLISALENVVTYLTIQVIILPILSMMLTIISIRELARVLGSEISFGRFDIF
jgi:hypothetical protein